MIRLFLADDGGGFWQTWKLDRYEQFPYPNLASLSREALLKQCKVCDGAEPVWLITDARFEFEDEPEYGGYRLCREFLDVSPANARAVIYSEEPKIPQNAGDHSRIRRIHRTSDDARDFSAIVTFLESGVCHRVEDLGLLIRQLLALGPVLQLAATGSVPLFRPPELMGTWRKPAYAGDVLLSGFGSSCVPLFSHVSSELFSDETRDELGHAVLGSPSTARWAQLRQILHPYDSLEIACAHTMEFSGLGVLRCFWEMTCCGGVPDGMSTSLSLDTGTLSPEKQRWIREKRAELRKALTEIFADPFAPASLTNLLKRTMDEIQLLKLISSKIEDLI